MLLLFKALFILIFTKESSTIVIVILSSGHIVLYKYAWVCVENTILFRNRRVMISQRSQWITTDDTIIIFFTFTATQAFECFIIAFFGVLILITRFLTKSARVWWSILLTVIYKKKGDVNNM